ncbi:MAG: hypothetical protein ABIZ69_14195, partial [Ilumatobacteraceae bacterium]
CVVATSCATTKSGVSAPQSAGPATSVPGSPATSAASMLEGVGVSIVDAAAPVTSGTDFTLTSGQVEFMDSEAAGHGGIRGDVLDAAGGGAPSGIPMSAVLAGWMRGVRTPAAKYSGVLMAAQDLTHPDGAVFPSVVLILFAADAAKQISADTVTPGSLRSSLSSAGFAPGRLQRGGGICSDVTKSIFDAVDRLFAKIHIPPGKVGDTGSSFLNGVLQGLTDVVVGTLNFVIDAARTLIVNGIKYLLDQVLSVVAEVAAAAALIGNFVSAVRPWRLEVKPEASDTIKGIDPDKVYDSATAKAILIGPTDDWPDWFVDCSKTAGVTLPSLLPVDAAVVWKVSTFSAGLMKESEDQFPKEVKLHKDTSGAVVAKLGLVTGMESAAQAATGESQQGNATVSATARRDQIEELRTTLVDAVHNLASRVLVVVPAIIRDYLLTLVDEAAGGGSNQLASLLDASASSTITVTYHGKPEPLGTAPVATVAKGPSQYCALFIDFSNWSLANLNAVMAEAAEETFTVRDAFFTEYLQRMAAMQKIAPAELHDALATFANYAQLYLAHDIAAVAAQAPTMTPAAAAINGYGKKVCGYDPQVTTGG